MKLIPDRDVLDTRVMGRDVLSGIKKPDGDDFTTINAPLKWLAPSAGQSGISFGSGVSYQTGEEPEGVNFIFPNRRRICLVETSLPSVDFTVVEVYSPSSRLVSLSVTSVSRTAEIQVITAPYHSKRCIIRQDLTCDPEIIVTMLGYRDNVRGLAIAEKIVIESTSGIRTEVIKRYPYFIPDYTSPLNNPLSRDAEEYYYTEKELEEAGGVTP